MFNAIPRLFEYNAYNLHDLLRMKLFLISIVKAFWYNVEYGISISKVSGCNEMALALQGISVILILEKYLALGSETCTQVYCFLVRPLYTSLLFPS